jgi:putative transposase
VGNKAAEITLTPRQRAVLEPLARARTAPQRVVERCRIILIAAEGRNNEELAEKLGVDRQRVRRWRARWAKAAVDLALAEKDGATDKDLEQVIRTVLADDERSGAPPTFTPEQIAGIIALACEPPSDSGLPVSHWTPAELAREAIKRKIVASISPRHVDRFLARRTSGRTRASTG